MLKQQLVRFGRLQLVLGLDQQEVLRRDWHCRIFHELLNELTRGSSHRWAHKQRLVSVVRPLNWVLVRSGVLLSLKSLHVVVDLVILEHHLVVGLHARQIGPVVKWSLLLLHKAVLAKVLLQGARISLVFLFERLPVSG